MELNTTMSVLRQFSLKQWHRIYTIQKHKICLLFKTTCYDVLYVGYPYLKSALNQIMAHDYS